MTRSRAYKETLDVLLTDPREAAAYLNAALEEGPDVFLLALRDVADIHGGIEQLAEVTDLNRENMYRMLSEDGNPRISSLSTILHALGLKLSITPEKSGPTAA
jgi:probable addiction module antidote protein